MCPTYEYSCKECDKHWEDVVQFEERLTQICSSCGNLALYHFPMAAVLSASLPDGTRRTGFSELKEAAKLKVEAANIDHRKRGGINAEIRKLESIKK